MRLRELVLLLRLVVVWYCFEEAGACCGLGRREAVFRRALAHARAGTACLPYLQHLLEVTFHALRL